MTRDIRTGVAWLAAAFAVGALTLAGVCPALFLARSLSEDGSLTASFSSLYVHAQRVIAVTLLVSAPVSFFASGIEDGARRLLLSMPQRLVLAMASGVASLATLVVQAHLFGNMPHMTDAIAHVFQAKIFAEGRVWMSIPPCAEHFFQHKMHMTESGRWFSLYPPGHALTLLPFLKLGLIDLFGPAAMAASTWMTIRLVQKFYGWNTAACFGILLATSPLMLLIGGSYMSHVSSFLYVSAGLLAAVHALELLAQRRGAAGWLFLAGFLLGMAALTRPQDAMVLAPAVLLGLIPAHRRGPVVAWRALPPFLAGVCIPAAILLVWNYAVYGRALAIGYGETATRDLLPLSIPSYGFTDAFTPSVALRHAMWTITRFDQALVGWPAGATSVLIAAAFVASKPDVRDFVCLTVLATTAGFYFFYAYYGFEYEARYYAVAAPFAIVLVVRGVRLLGTPAVLLIAAFAVHAAVHYWPAYIVPAYGGDYEQATPALRNAVCASGLKNVVVLIPDQGPEAFRYSSGFAWNDPLLRGAVIYARDIPGKNECLTNAFPGRSFYRSPPGGKTVAPVTSP